MKDIFDRLVTRPLDRFYETLMEFIPNLFSAALILLIGLAVGWLVKVLLQKLFVSIDLDGRSDRSGMKSVLHKSGVGEPLSLLLARLIGSFVVFVFFLAALNNLEFGIIQSLIERLFHYLPNLLIALFIAVLGYMLGNFLGRAALIAAVNAGMKIASPIGRGVKLLVYMLTVSMVLEQLGIGRETVLVSFGIIFSGVVLALAIAFGLGGKDVAREYLEKRFGQSQEDDDFHHL